MAAKWPRKIGVIDDVSSGIAEIIRSSLNHNPAILTTKNFQTSSLKDIDLVFLVLDNSQPFQESLTLSSHSKPERPIDVLWEITKNSSIPVHVVVPVEHHQLPGQFTALDTIALALSGAAGVWEGSIKLATSLRPEMFDLIKASWTNKRLFLFGSPATHLYQMYMQITTKSWPIEAIDPGQYKPAHQRYCFEVAIALASLTIEDLTLSDEKTSNMNNYAARLLNYSNRTGLNYSQPVIYRTLLSLEKGWSDRIPNHSHARRNEMPIYARQDGFPARMPLIRGLKVPKIPRAIYETILELDFERDWDPTKGLMTSVTIGHHNF